MNARSLLFALPAVPGRLRYPHASEPTCLTIQVVMHYDGEVGRVGSYAEESYRQAARPDGSMAFSHSYWMYERPRPHHQVFALVGYRWERLDAEP